MSQPSGDGNRMGDDTSEDSSVENVDWSQLSLAQLKRIQSRISQVINLKRRDSERVTPTADAPRSHRYAATLARVSPHHLRDSLSDYQRCVFIVSLGSKKYVDSGRLAACIHWIARRFAACVMLVGDSVYRLTLELRHQSSGAQARRQAVRAGREFIDQHRHLVERHADRCEFEFRLGSEIAKRPDYKIYYEALQDTYRTNEPFHRLVDSFADTYLNRGHSAQPVGTPGPNHHLATTYLLEESAIFTCLAEQGWSVLVYPGSIRTFEEISEGLHPEVPEPLRRTVWASLRLKKKKSSQGTSA